jgi:hypothetical protein
MWSSLYLTHFKNYPAQNVLILNYVYVYETIYQR